MTIPIVPSSITLNPELHWKSSLQLTSFQRLKLSNNSRKICSGSWEQTQRQHAIKHTKGGSCVWAYQSHNTLHINDSNKAQVPAVSVLEFPRASHRVAQPHKTHQYYWSTQKSTVLNLCHRCYFNLLSFKAQRRRAFMGPQASRDD